MPATDKLLTDLHISYIQELGKVSGFFFCRSVVWHHFYRTKMTSCTISPLTWDLTLFIGGLLRFVFSVTPKHSAEMRWSTSWWVVGTRRQVLYFPPFNPPEPFCYFDIIPFAVVLPHHHRSIRRSPQPRCPSTLYTERDSDIGYTKCIGYNRQRSSGQMWFHPAFPSPI